MMLLCPALDQEMSRANENLKLRDVLSVFLFVNILYKIKHHALTKAVARRYWSLISKCAWAYRIG